MYVSAFELFKVGIGPSSSHTVGPMVAANRFANYLVGDDAPAALRDNVASVTVELFGSLAFTGKGHGSDTALMMGLSGELPASVDIESVQSRAVEIRTAHALTLGGRRRIDFDPEKHIIFRRRERLPLHSNGMRFTARDATGATSLEKVFYSVGGGFVVDGQGAPTGGAPSEQPVVPYPFASGAALLQHCKAQGLSISALIRANEAVLAPRRDLSGEILDIWRVMEACIDRGCRQEGVLPGGLKVQRRAASLARRLRAEHGPADQLVALDWVNLWAIAVNEENAAGGRVVTAPTNGAAGIIPAVIKYYRTFIPRADDDGTVRFLLTAAAIGSLYKQNASISGAEVGCQGEVGVACSMAAGGLAEAMGATPAQIENAAEIGMEHNLGLTCDPIGGLVQVPCIERNAMGSVKAINAARLAMSGDGTHKVSLDRVIQTMRQTGADMSTKYKETSRGGLAVNVIEC